MERLQKLLSTAGVASRRTAEDLIRQGRVSVNGRTVTELGTKAGPGDEIRVDGRRVKAAQTLRYLLVHKPRGYVTTRNDPQKRRTVMELLAGVREYRLSGRPAGLRLRGSAARDQRRRPRGGADASAARGRARVPRRSSPACRTSARSTGWRAAWCSTGAGRPRRWCGCRLRIATSRRSPTVLLLTIREGRNRQVRRMCEAVGHPVQRLTRVRIGPLRDDRLRAGQVRELTADEVRALKRAVAAPRKSSDSRSR